MLFIDARTLGRMVDRTHRELTDEDIARIADTYHAWRGEEGAGDYADVPGFCKSASLEEVRKHSHVLTPGRYVGAAPQEEDDEPFEDKMKRLVAQLRDQQDQGAELDAAIKANLAAPRIRGGMMAAVYYHMGRFPPDDRLRLAKAGSLHRPGHGGSGALRRHACRHSETRRSARPPHHPRSRALLAHFLEPLGHCGRPSNALTFTHDSLHTTLFVAHLQNKMTDKRC